MMISDLQEGDKTSIEALCTSCKEAQSKKGDAYLIVELQDQSGSIEGRVWDDVERIKEVLQPRECVWADGRVDSYRDQLQFRIEDAGELEGVTAAAFLRRSRFSMEVMVDGLLDLIREHTESPLTEVLLRALEIADGFEEARAAMKNHHAYACGLLEHTYSMARLGVMIGQHYATYYPGLIRVDLILAGVLLHDIGKVWEYNQVDGSVTDVGELVGHIGTGVEIITRAMADTGTTDPDLGLELRHLVLSHHGRKEFGSPVEPKTAEAILLSRLDDLDSRMGMVAEAVSDVTPGAWSEKVWPLGVRVYRRRN